MLPKPNKAFFELEERSKKLRELSIEAISYINQYIEDPMIVRNPMKAQKILSYLDLVVNELKSLGIYPNISSGLGTEVYFTLPVKAAEWLAGQILNTLERVGELPTIGELLIDFEHTSLDTPMILSIDEQTPNSENFRLIRGLMSSMRNMLDISQDEITAYILE